MISGSKKKPLGRFTLPAQMRSLLATHTWSLISSPPTLFGLPWAGVPPSATARLCRPQATWPQHPWTGQPPQATHCHSPAPCRVNSVPCCARGQKGVAGQWWQVLSVNSHSLGADGGPSKKRGDGWCPVSQGWHEEPGAGYQPHRSLGRSPDKHGLPSGDSLI